MPRLLHTETPIEFFREQVDAALAHHRLRTGQLTSLYLVNLLTGFVAATQADDEAIDTELLTVCFLQALEAEGARQRLAFRQVGDRALFLSGFFGDSLERHAISVNHYIGLGARAYGWLSRHGRDGQAPVFAELATRFAAFVDVLSEISERSALATDADLLRLYGKWARTGSPAREQLLMERGLVVPPAGVANRVH